MVQAVGTYLSGETAAELEGGVDDIDGKCSLQHEQEQGEGIGGGADGGGYDAGAEHAHGGGSGL